MNRLTCICFQRRVRRVEEVAILAPAKHLDTFQPPGPPPCTCTSPPNPKLQTRTMSLVSGPGRGGMADMPAEMRLYVDKHVSYIQSLDKVRLPEPYDQVNGLR